MDHSSNLSRFCPAVSSLPITLVIPVRNEIGSLHELLSGIDALSPCPAEVVFVISASSDGSADAIDSWAGHSHLFAVRSVSEPGAFPGGARNSGVKVASESWIAFVDAGIVPNPDWLRWLWACKENSGSLAVYGSCRFHSDHPFGRVVCALSYGQESVTAVLPASLFSRQVFDQAGLFDDRIRSGEDVIWKRKIKESGVNIIECKDALVEYRHFPNTFSDAIKKWFVYESSATLAGLWSPGRVIFQFLILIAYATILWDLSVGLTLLLVYVIARGILDPMRRSNSRVWWCRWWQPLLAILVAAALDLAAIAGRMSAALGLKVMQGKSRIVGSP